MKKFLLFLFFIFNIHSLSIADDIKDFQIEGMSIGDSLLSYMSKKEIKKKIINQNYHNNDFKAIYLERRNDDIKIYDAVYVDYKNDEKFIIHAISGILYIKNYSNKKCFKKKKEIVNEIKSMFPNNKFKDDSLPHPGDTSGKSIVYRTSVSHPESFYLPIEVSCFDWSKKMKYKDHLRFSIKSDDYNDWLFEG